MGTICQELRRVGQVAIGYNWFHTYLNYKRQIVNTDGYELLKILDPLSQYCDLFHYQNGNSLLEDYRDLPMLMAVGKKLVMHHWGNDVRNARQVKELNPYPLPPSYLSDQQIASRLEKSSRHIKTAIVQDYEMLPYVKEYYERVNVLPLACNVRQYQPRYPVVDKKEPLLLHAPTNRAFKGTDIVEQAVKELQRTHHFHYQAVERMRHAEAVQLYLQADIIIDQLLCGTYGMLAVEAMAMGKVVVANIRDDVRAKLPADLPIIHATPESLVTVLRQLIEQPERRYAIGKASRAFAERYHAVEVIVGQLLNIYATL